MAMKDILGLLKGAWEATGNAIGGVRRIAFTPPGAVRNGVSAIAHSQPGKYLAGGAAAGAAAVGIKDWESNRKAYGDEQDAAASQLSQNIAENKATIAKVQASLGDPGARDDNAARVRAQQERASATPSLSA